MLKKILIVVVVLVAAFLAIVALQPAAYRVSRTTMISAPPTTPYALVNDFHRWAEWSPWAKIDPNMKETYSGPAQGPGSVYEWAGNGKVGSGRMTILESRPGELVRVKLEFIKPFASTTTTDFTFRPGGDGTGVAWSMYGDNDFMGKAMCLFAGMDKMVGPDFERGLAQLKTASEKRAAR